MVGVRDVLGLALAGRGSSRTKASRWGIAGEWGPEGREWLQKGWTEVTSKTWLNLHFGSTNTATLAPRLRPDLTERASKAPDVQTLRGPLASHRRERRAWETHVGLCDPSPLPPLWISRHPQDNRFQERGPDGTSTWPWQERKIRPCAALFREISLFQRTVLSLEFMSCSCLLWQTVPFKKFWLFEMTVIVARRVFCFGFCLCSVLLPGMIRSFHGFQKCLSPTFCHLKNKNLWDSLFRLLSKGLLKFYPHSFFYFMEKNWPK